MKARPRRAFCRRNQPLFARHQKKAAARPLFRCFARSVVSFDSRRSNFWQLTQTPAVLWRYRYRARYVRSTSHGRSVRRRRSVSVCFYVQPSRISSDTCQHIVNLCCRDGEKAGARKSDVFRRANSDECVMSRLRFCALSLRLITRVAASSSVCVWENK